VQEQTDSAAAIDAALFRLRRVWAKPLRPRNYGEPGRSVQMSNLMVMGAIQRLSATCAEVTVGAVAEDMDVEPSTASRLVNDAIAAGFVGRETSKIDARRVRLVLTETGRRVRKAVAAHRRAHVDRLIADWEPGEREVFARLLTRFAETSAAYHADLTRLDRVIADALAGDTP
jgi:DNA-binding MarR family transcriptional regulator